MWLYPDMYTVDIISCIVLCISCRSTTRTALVDQNKLLWKPGHSSTGRGTTGWERGLWSKTNHAPHSLKCWFTCIFLCCFDFLHFRPFLSRMKETVNDFQQRHTGVQRLLAWLLSVFMLHLLPSFKRAATSVKWVQPYYLINISHVINLLGGMFHCYMKEHVGK